MNTQCGFGQSWSEDSFITEDPRFDLGYIGAESTQPMDYPRLDTNGIDMQRQTRHSLGSLPNGFTDNELLNPLWQVSPVFNRDVHEDPWDHQRAGRTTALDRAVPRSTGSYKEPFVDSGIGSASGIDKQSVVSAPPAGEYVLSSGKRRCRNPRYSRLPARRGPIDTASTTSELTPCLMCFREKGITRIPKNQADKKYYKAPSITIRCC